MLNKKLQASIVGGETPIGRELRDILKESKTTSGIQSLGADPEVAGILSENEGEASVIAPIDADRLKSSDVVFFAGTAQSTSSAFALLKGWPDTRVVDLTYALEDEPAARLRAPVLEGEDFRIVPDAVHVVAHPAAIAAALILRTLHSKLPIERAVLQIFEPASERGQAGMTELQQQTTALLTFQPVKKTVFDAQAGFAMLPRYGEDAPEKLQLVEERIHRHLASLLAAESVPMPSLRLVQAPVFHGYSLSFWVELAERSTPKELELALATSAIEVRDAELDPPTNVGIVGQSGVTVGTIEGDRHNPKAFWIWAVADNYRLMAENAVAVLAAKDPA